MLLSVSIATLAYVATVPTSKDRQHLGTPEAVTLSGICIGAGTRILVPMPVFTFASFI